MMILRQVSGVERSGALATQDERLAAIAAAAAAVLRRTPYHAVRAGDVAAAIQLPGDRGRSAVWLYHEVRKRPAPPPPLAAFPWPRGGAGSAAVRVGDGVPFGRGRGAGRNRHVPPGRAAA